MQTRQIGRHLKRLAEVGVSAGPVLVGLLEKRYPKYAPLGRQALELIEAIREEGRGDKGMLPTSAADYPSSSPIPDGYSAEPQFDPRIQEDALGGILREALEKEQLLRAQATARDVSETPR